MKITQLTICSLCGLTWLFSSCASDLKSSVPGVKNNMKKVHGVNYSHVISAIKIQIAQAQFRIKEMQEDNPDHPSSGLSFKEGNGLLVATVETSRTDSGGISVVIPFSGLKGTKGTPGWGGDRSATDTRIEAFSFSIKPTNGKAVNKRSLSKFKHIQIGNVIENALVNNFVTIRDASKDSSGKPVGAELIPQSISVTTTFKVVRNSAGGVSFEIIPTGHIPKVSPELGTAHSLGATNQISVTLPFITPSKPLSDTRRLIYPLRDKGDTFYIEVPYNEELKNKLLAGVPLKKVNREKLEKNKKIQAGWMKGLGLHNNPNLLFLPPSEKIEPNPGLRTPRPEPEPAPF